MGREGLPGSLSLLAYSLVCSTQYGMTVVVSVFFLLQFTNKSKIVVGYCFFSYDALSCPTANRNVRHLQDGLDMDAVIGDERYVQVLARRWLVGSS